MITFLSNVNKLSLWLFAAYFPLLSLSRSLLRLLNLLSRSLTPTHSQFFVFSLSYSVSPSLTLFLTLLLHHTLILTHFFRSLTYSRCHSFSFLLFYEHLGIPYISPPLSFDSKTATSRLGSLFSLRPPPPPKPPRPQKWLITVKQLTLLSPIKKRRKIQPDQRDDNVLTGIYVCEVYWLTFWVDRG